jgi:hypothetical protein
MSITTKIDPALATALDAAAGSDTMVEAVVRLHRDAAAGPLKPEVTESRAQELLQRVHQDVGANPQVVNVFRNLGSFVVVAVPDFIRHLISQPEVESAVANRRPGSGMIKPVSKRPVDLEDVGKEPPKKVPKK